MKSLKIVDTCFQMQIWWESNQIKSQKKLWSKSEKNSYLSVCILISIHISFETICWNIFKTTKKIIGIIIKKKHKEETQKNGLDVLFYHHNIQHLPKEAENILQLLLRRWKKKQPVKTNKIWYKIPRRCSRVWSFGLMKSFQLASMIWVLNMVGVIWARLLAMLGLRTIKNLITVVA